jgi:hypothetical protein
MNFPFFLIPLLINLVTPNCNDVRTGRFLLRDKISGETTIYRTEWIQREENDKFGIITEDSVKWINDCTYTLIPYRVIKNNSKIPIETDFKLQIEIVEVKEKSYRQKTTSLITGEIFTNEVMIVKPALMERLE